MVCGYEVVIAVLLGSFHPALIELSYLREMLFYMHRDIELICRTNIDFASLVVT